MHKITLKKSLQSSKDLVEKTTQDNLPFKIILSKPSESEYIKTTYAPIQAGGNLKVKKVNKTKTQEFTEVIDFSMLFSDLENQLETAFCFMDLMTPTKSFHIKISKKGKVSAFFGTSTLKNETIYAHDKNKNYLITRQTPFLYHLGITSKEGNVLTKFQKKYKQINRFIELIDHLTSNNEILHVVDMGSGKGYLTFALYHYLTNKHPDKEVSIIGYEIRPDLVIKCNRIAQEVGFKNLNFKQNSIHKADIKSTDLLVALHACDIATDMAISKGLEGHAKYIVLSPCCHKQIRKEISIEDEITKHGIYKERLAEMITDTIRALILESKGYSSNIFEFIGSEHTAKNTMLTGKLTNIENKEALNKILMIKEKYGIKTHYLETLL